MYNINQITNQQYIALRNTHSTRQASVAIIMRGNVQCENDSKQLNVHNVTQAKFKQLNNLEVLFIQRSHNPKDPNSGEIAFPGGKNDHDESDLEAAIRETYEEIGLDLMKIECYYLYRLKENVFMRTQHNGQNLYCSAHVFIINDPYHRTDNLKLSQQEIIDFKWVPLDLFFNSPNLIMRTNYHYFGFKQISRFFKKAETPGIDIGMKDVLYGFTFFLTVVFLMDISNQQQLQNIWEHAHKSKFEFSGPLGPFLQLGASIGFRSRRVSMIDKRQQLVARYLVPLLIIVICV